MAGDFVGLRAEHGIDFDPPAARPGEFFEGLDVLRRMDPQEFLPRGGANRPGSEPVGQTALFQLPMNRREPVGAFGMGSGFVIEKSLILEQNRHPPSSLGISALKVENWPSRRVSVSKPHCRRHMTS